MTTIHKCQQMLQYFANFFVCWTKPSLMHVKGSALLKAVWESLLSQFVKASVARYYNSDSIITFWDRELCGGLNPSSQCSPSQPVTCNPALANFQGAEIIGMSS